MDNTQDRRCGVDTVICDGQCELCARRAFRREGVSDESC